MGHSRNVVLNFHKVKKNLEAAEVEISCFLVRSMGENTALSQNATYSTVMMLISLGGFQQL